MRIAFQRGSAALRDKAIHSLLFKNKLRDDHEHHLGIPEGGRIVESRKKGLRLHNNCTDQSIEHMKCTEPLVLRTIPMHSRGVVGLDGEGQLCGLARGDLSEEGTRVRGESQPMEIQIRGVDATRGESWEEGRGERDVRPQLVREKDRNIVTGANTDGRARVGAGGSTEAEDSGVE